MTTNNVTSSNSNSNSVYNTMVARAKKAERADRLANLNAVSNCAKKAYPGIKTNEAIARYCGVKFESLRSYKQCSELGLTPDEIHRLPVIDVWGANSEEYCNSNPAAPKYYPRAAFVVPADVLGSFAKVDGVNGAGIAAPAEYTAPDYNPLTTPTEAAEDFADALAEATAPAAAPKTSRRRITRTKKTPAPVVMAADDLPF